MTKHHDATFTLSEISIPADVAKQMAAAFRVAADMKDQIEAVSAGFVRVNQDGCYEWADLLDPKPPSLREQVAKAWCADYYGEYSRSAKDPVQEHLDAADAVLAVVAEAPIEWVLATFGPRLSDWLVAQPRTPLYAIDLRHAERNQRDHDVRLLRGGSDG